MNINFLVGFFCAVTLLLLLSGCSVVSQVSVEMEIACSQLEGKVGNNCRITVPDTADVHVNGENIEIYYKGKRS